MYNTIRPLCQNRRRITTDGSIWKEWMQIKEQFRIAYRNVMYNDTVYKGMGEA